MPSKERVQALIALVEKGEYVEALEQFYAQDASMQENNEPARIGLASLVEHERKVLAGLKEMRTNPVDWFVVDGDRVVINWVFEFIDPAGRKYRLDELAHQLWRGDRVVRERFYYDPVQTRRAEPTT